SQGSIMSTRLHIIFHSLDSTASFGRGLPSKKGWCGASGVQANRPSDLDGRLRSAVCRYNFGVKGSEPRITEKTDTDNVECA
ncbi:hypothetical protein THAOC_00168, partial [Thalassiosira oceanica]